MKKFMILVTSFALWAASSNAWAGQDSFDTLAKNATELRSGDALASLFWSFNVNCNQEKTQIGKRQCKAIKSARAKTVPEATFLIDGDPTAIRVGDFNKNTKKLSFSVDACVACTDGVPSTNGTKALVVGGAASIRGGVLRSAQLAAVKTALEDEKQLAEWKKEVLPRLRTQFLFKVPATGNSWTKGAFSGHRVQVVGFRVIDRCDGSIVASNLKSSSVTPESNLCPKVKVDLAKKDKAAKKVVVKKGPRIPRRLSTSTIRRTLAPVRKESLRCFDDYGVPGVSKFRITFNNDGVIIAVEQNGDFEETPTGNCIIEAIKKITFGKSIQTSTAIVLPIVLK